jgi:hypothetical protein
MEDIVRTEYICLVGLSGVKLLRNHNWAKTGRMWVANLPVILIPAVDHCPDLDGKKRALYRVQQPGLWVV